MAKVKQKGLWFGVFGAQSFTKLNRK